MEAALFLCGLFPPPAPGPFVFAGVGDTGAGGAADRLEAFVVERVVGDLVLQDVLPDLGRGPVGEGVPFDEGPFRVDGEAGVKLNNGDLIAGAGALVAALAGDVGVDPVGQGAAQGFDFADAAALGVAVAAEREQPLLLDELLHSVRLGEERFDGDVVTVADRLKELKGLGVEPARIQRESAEGEAKAGGHVDQDDVFGAAEGDGQLGTEARESSFDDVSGVLGGEVGRARFYIECLRNHLEASDSWGVPLNHAVPGGLFPALLGDPGGAY